MDKFRTVTDRKPSSFQQTTGEKVPVMAVAEMFSRVRSSACDPFRTLVETGEERWSKQRSCRWQSTQEYRKAGQPLRQKKHEATPVCLWFVFSFGDLP